MNIQDEIAVLAAENWAVEVVKHVRNNMMVS